MKTRSNDTKPNRFQTGIWVFMDSERDFRAVLGYVNIIRRMYVQTGAKVIWHSIFNTMPPVTRSNTESRVKGLLRQCKYRDSRRSFEIWKYSASEFLRYVNPNSFYGSQQVNVITNTNYCPQTRWPLPSRRSTFRTERRFAATHSENIRWDHVMACGLQSSTDMYSKSTPPGVPLSSISTNTERSDTTATIPANAAYTNELEQINLMFQVSWLHRYSLAPSTARFRQSISDLSLNTRRDKFCVQRQTLRVSQKKRLRHQ
jgi:hypothetical protein